jgi:YggT family protein
MVAYNIFTVLASAAQLFSYLLLIRVLLTWFPGVDWNNGVLSALSSLTDPYLNIFRGVIPPIGGFDISSILAFLLLNVIVDTLGGVAGNFASIGY